MMHSTPIKSTPRSAESLEKYTFINIRQDGNPEYKRFSETYAQRKKSRWELSGLVQASPAAIKNPGKYPDLADEWLDGKEHRLKSPRTYSTAEVIEQIRYEFRAAKAMGNKHLQVTGIVVDKKDITEDKPKKTGCWHSRAKKPVTKKTTRRTRSA